MTFVIVATFGGRAVAFVYCCGTFLHNRRYISGSVKHPTASGGVENYGRVNITFQSPTKTGSRMRKHRAQNDDDCGDNDKV